MFFFFLLIADLEILIPANISQHFNPAAEFAIHIGIPLQKQKQKWNLYVTAETKISKCSI